MLEFLLDLAENRQLLVMTLAGIAAAATVLTLAMPLLATDQLEKRMTAVANERERIRQRERERMARGEKGSLRTSPRQYMQTVVEKFKLSDYVGQEAARAKLIEAGYRGHGPYVVFLFFRFVAPIAMLVLSVVYVFLVLQLDISWTLKLLICIGATWLGMQLPNLFINNRIQRRQASISRAFPDALDLLLICVESGMSLEAAFQRVSQEIGQQSIELAEELTLSTAELSYLPDRRQAFENLAKRVPLEGVKSLSLALQQSERFGTPMATTLRVIAQENRDQRMNNAEKKAAALPPQLTVPMILFFLPVLFIVILGPAIIKIIQQFK
jgi:tight adherence protein C